ESRSGGNTPDNTFFFESSDPDYVTMNYASFDAYRDETYDAFAESSGQRVIACIARPSVGANAMVHQGDVSFVLNELREINGYAFW
ncbi:hypothetical protein AaE_014609, partial [Aphanomyces astaci]